MDVEEPGEATGTKAGRAWREVCPVRAAPARSFAHSKRTLEGISWQVLWRRSPGKQVRAARRKRKTRQKAGNPGFPSRERPSVRQVGSGKLLPLGRRQKRGRRGGFTKGRAGQEAPLSPGRVAAGADGPALGGRAQAGSAGGGARQVWVQREGGAQNTKANLTASGGPGEPGSQTELPKGSAGCQPGSPNPEAAGGSPGQRGDPAVPGCSCRPEEGRPRPHAHTRATHAPGDTCLEGPCRGWGCRRSRGEAYTQCPP